MLQLRFEHGNYSAQGKGNHQEDGEAKRAYARISKRGYSIGFSAANRTTLVRRGAKSGFATGSSYRMTLRS